MWWLYSTRHQLFCSQGSYRSCGLQQTCHCDPEVWFRSSSDKFGQIWSWTPFQCMWHWDPGRWSIPGQCWGPGVMLADRGILLFFSTKSKNLKATEGVASCPTSPAPKCLGFAFTSSTILVLRLASKQLPFRRVAYPWGKVSTEKNRE